MYNDPTTSFQHNFFPEFTNVSNTYCRITQDWVIDLNDGNEHLVFCIIEQSHMVHFIVTLIGEHFLVIWKSFDQVVKDQCTATCDLLVLELEQRFPNHELMNVLGIIYPQCSLQPNCESTFMDHFALIKHHYRISKKLALMASGF
jgi:hypothetical protein